MLEMLFKRPKSPEEIFTPRAAAVNKKMYIPRPGLEKALQEGLNGSLHLVIHGESGCGKSWLYKKVLGDLDATTEVGNLANASRLGSITSELKNLISRKEEPSKTRYRESKKAGINAGVASGGLEHQGEFEVGEKEPFERVLHGIRSRAGKGMAVLVLDNLEAATENAKLLEELANLIVLIDDDRYAQYRVKLIIVGVPRVLRQYYAKTPNLKTVANRLYELPEVSRLTEEQAEQLVQKGFVDQLRCPIEDQGAVTKHISWVTDRIPQRLHEYCLELARLAQAAQNKIGTSLLKGADRKWLRKSLYAAYTTVENAMNERETKIGRRNQTLYSLGQTQKDEFRWSDIEVIVRREFPETTQNKTLNISQILSELAAYEEPIIKSLPKGDSYRFKDPMYRMCIRTMLEKQPDGERVSKLELAGLSNEAG